MGGKETGAVGVALLGFAVLVLGFRGTWGKLWTDLWGGSPPGGSNSSSSSSATSGQSTEPTSAAAANQAITGFGGNPSIDPGFNLPTVPSGARLPQSRVSTPTAVNT